MIDAAGNAINFVSVLGVFWKEHLLWFLISLALVGGLAYKAWTEPTKTWVIAFCVTLLGAGFSNYYYWNEAKGIVTPPVQKSGSLFR
jgi:hypothetical protein